MRRTDDRYEEVNDFVRPPEGYIRDLDILGNTRLYLANYLHLKTGMDMELCNKFAQDKIQVEKLNPKDCKITGKKPVGGDRVIGKKSFHDIITTTAEKDYVISPNMVVYKNADQQKSHMSTYISDKMANRAVIKKESIELEARGDKLKAFLKSSGEGKIKLLINTISGAFGSVHNPLYNKTAHSTLTSTTRICTSYSNANSELFLANNRHLFSVEVIRSLIVSVYSKVNRAEVNEVMEHYNLKYPTAEIVKESFRESSKFYLLNQDDLSTTLKLLDNVDKETLAMLMYGGSLEGLKTVNPEFVWGMLDEVVPSTNTNPTDLNLKTVDGDITAWVGIVFGEFLLGTTPKELKENDEPTYNRYCNTILDIYKWLEKYSLLFRTLMACDFPPTSIWDYPSSIRKNVVGSDTDSTMGTVQDWIYEKFDSFIFNNESNSLAATLIYMSSQMTSHWLAGASRQMGVRDEELYRLKMKNEYFMPIYMRANRAKHYVTLLTSREGTILKNPKLDLKGVGLVNSKWPKEIKDYLTSQFEEVAMHILGGKQVSINVLLQRMANLEHKVRDSIRNGEVTYLLSETIKPATTYKAGADNSTYKQHDMWLSVWQNKYGRIEEPTYSAFQMPITITNRVKLDAWLSTLDPTVKTDMEAWFEKNDYAIPKTLILSKEGVGNKIPEELIDIIDVDRLLSVIMDGFYILVEMLGYFCRNKGQTRLIHKELMRELNVPELNEGY